MKRSIKTFALTIAILCCVGTAFAQVPGETTTYRKKVAKSILDSLPLILKTVPKPDLTVVKTARLKLHNSVITRKLKLPTLDSKEPSTSVPFTFAKTRPTVIVLIHGITGYPETPGNELLGSLRGARDYWGYDFVQGLLMDKTQGNVLHTFESNTDFLTAGNWKSASTANDDNINDHFVSYWEVPNPNAALEAYTPLSVMFTYRDGSRSFGVQVADAADQIVSLYHQKFGNWPADKQPQLILMGHSFGGLIARSICSKVISFPSDASLELQKQIRAYSFNNTDLQNFDFIRNRTMHITTISTPHTGSRISYNADLGETFQNVAQTANAFVPFGVVLGALGGVYTQIDNTDPDAPIIDQLSEPYVKKLNQTVLQPEKCKRADNSFIPIHVIGGRSPAGPNHFENPNDFFRNDYGSNGLTSQVENITLAANATTQQRDAYESFNLMKCDYLMHLLFGTDYSDGRKKVWGQTTDPDFDRVSIVDVRSPAATYVNCLAKPWYQLITFKVKPRMYYTRKTWNDSEKPKPHLIWGECNQAYSSSNTTPRDGEIDCDGFVPINSSMGTYLGTGVKNIFDHSTNGSWYRFYTSAADWHNHGTIKYQYEVGEWIKKNIIGYMYLNAYTGGNNAAGPRVAADGTKSVW